MRIAFPAAVLTLLPRLAQAALVPGGGAAPGGDLPEPLRSLASWAFALQRQLNGEMRQHLAAMKETGSWEPATAIVLAAFLYGIFHAIGPGHGKVVIAGWFATRRARIMHGLIASLIAAMVQSASAIAVVLALAGILALTPKDVLASAGWLEVASYAMIAGLGAVMCWRTATGKGCGHDHSHHHDHDGACCGHHHHAPVRITDPRAERNTLFAVSAAVGFRPCSGAILVLLFCFANEMMLVGVLATFAMGLGVAITIAAIGMGALGLNRLIETRFGDKAIGGRIRTGLALTGALAITLLGVVLLVGAVVNGPSLGG
ncbi:ABC transporter [Paramagnetospirillum kuznetsovii]|uniref:Nickel/cobalt efflux system n=1 Tax=Paramagnetospirillum kuznetsovii TaxID=2053833 RepID=A0A364NV32_9PROT|nr:ABC transporter [Paramagnetospirillum kuznetsovii]RAU20926.1 ABC transporter [Paramagnetospirillum kuznetsovii]